ncbi:MAG: VWA domain-containing protein, partial [Acidobacteriota bacterium]|nr:VWA domain-containing protein [Acidobacteriota bacterium]
SSARSGLSWYQPVHMLDPGSGLDDTERYGLLNASRASYLATGTQATIRYAISGLREMPGRKAVALFSDGFVQSVTDTVEMANRASVVLYTFDARGLVTFNLTASDSVYASRSSLNIDRFENRRENQFYANQRGLRLLAEETGGTFFHDNNGLARGLTEAMDDMGSYYLIAYEPRRDDFDRIRGQLQYHRIKVKVRRPYLTVRSRNGFFGFPDRPETLRTLTPQEELRDALNSPFRAAGFPVYLKAFAGASPDARTGKLQTTLRALLLIDARGLKREEIADGKQRLAFSLLAGIWAENDQPLALIDRTYTIEKTAEEMRQGIASGLAIEIEIPVPRPGPFQLRSAVLEPASGKIGAAREFIDVPDFAQSKPSLSSILISDADPVRGALLDRAGVLGGGSSVTRVFAPGAVLDYQCRIFGIEHPQIEVHLFHGEERIFTGSRLAVTPAASGQIKLPPTLPAGDYALEILAWNPVKPKAAPASQWVDFTLLNPEANRSELP